uniref:Uncharacterized protein n=1 Tax=Arundo donax TaxID=35708 RepID=A0A0A8YY85_ARUDO
MCSTSYILPDLADFSHISTMTGMLFLGARTPGLQLYHSFYLRS